MTPHKSFFGDAEYAFNLSAPLIIELESKCGSGVGALCSRVFLKQFAQADINETIRLALIGGGTAPKRAAELVAAYAVDRPMSQSYPIAAKILERLWFGNPHDEVGAA